MHLFTEHHYERSDIIVNNDTGNIRSPVLFLIENKFQLVTWYSLTIIIVLYIRSAYRTQPLYYFFFIYSYPSNELNSFCKLCRSPVNRLRLEILFFLLHTPVHYNLYRDALAKVEDERQTVGGSRPQYLFFNNFLLIYCCDLSICRPKPPKCVYLLQRRLLCEWL